MKKLRSRIIAIVIVAIGSVILFMPLEEKISLGLDLKGGMHIVAQVQTEQAVNAEAEQYRDRIANDLNEKQIPFTEVRLNDDFAVEITGVPPDQRAAVNSYLDEFYPSNNFSKSSNTNDGAVDFELRMLVAYQNLLKNEAVRQARNVISRRVDQYGVAEPSIQVYGEGAVPDQIIIELPGVDDPERVRALIQGTGDLELKLVDPEKGGPWNSERDALAAFNDLLPSHLEILPHQLEEGELTPKYLVVRKAASITGSHLKTARSSQDSLTGAPEVRFFLTAEGVQLFSKATGDHVGERLAVVLDDVIFTFPNINDRIDTESAVITGIQSRQEAEDVALILKTGALPAKIVFLADRTVGPSLGQDSIRRGINASLLGLLLVVTSMFVIYRLSGLNAIICLALNLVILLGVLAGLRATLTLPGIAGMILTIGMAVDANILIFERIKEELRLGKAVRSAVESGFGRVFWTIIDTNVTTLIASLFLFQFGTGPIKGFAVTLAIGLLANIFTATFVSKTFFLALLQRRQVERLSI